MLGYSDYFYHFFKIFAVNEVMSWEDLRRRMRSPDCSFLFLRGLAEGATRCVPVFLKWATSTGLSQGNDFILENFIIFILTFNSPQWLRGRDAYSPAIGHWNWGAEFWCFYGKFQNHSF